MTFLGDSLWTLQINVTIENVYVCEKFGQELGGVVDLLKAYLDVIKMQCIVICIKLCSPYSQTYLGQNMHSLLVSSPMPHCPDLNQSNGLDGGQWDRL